MQIIILNQHDTVLNNYLAQIRDKDIQQDPLRFRRNLQRIGMIMAYEVSKRLSYEGKEVTTPLGTTTVQQTADQIVVGSIMRAGIPMHQGVLDIFDHAESCFISAFRKYVSADSFSIDLQYVATPKLDNKILLLNDPMLATGSSLALTYEALKKFGIPKHTHLMSIIGAQAGVDYISNVLKDEKVTLWLGAVDADLNSHKYIVPGLGDAGDLAFGEKL